MRKIILASASSYRRDLLKRLIKDFTCLPSEINEDHYKKLYSDGKTMSLELAKIKALDVYKRNPEALIIGSDQCLVLGQEIMGKSHHFEGAVAQLMKLQGQEHSLFTSVALISKEVEFAYTQEVKLKMKLLSKEDITHYVDQDRPYDCAGSYKLEEKGIALFDEVSCDDYTGIIGLPLIRLGKKLTELGYELFKKTF
jgi:septum formation protein